jgi:hypothetical protein
MSQFLPHYCCGNLSTAFVFSAPGAEEAHSGRPVSGDTGENLDIALALLNSARPALFPSASRYDYRITNAFSEPRAKSLGHKSSEARTSEIRDSQNVTRVIDELSGCNLVILCGNKAQLLFKSIEKCGREVIVAPHPGNKGLNMAFGRLPNVRGAADRRRQRVHSWVQRILNST